MAIALCCVAAHLNAQISWNGIYDFGISKGGKDSRPGWNQLPNSYLQFNVRNLQLFVDAGVSNDISVSGKISAYQQNSLDPRFIDLELANVTFWRLAGNALNVSVGKILTPFGAFTRRQLSPDNPLIGYPLFFSYQTKVSPIVGYLGVNSIGSYSSSYGSSLSTMYYGGYFVGADAFGSLANDFFEYSLAGMNAPLSSPTNAVNLDKEPAFHGRIAVNPAIWCTLGLSYCYGSFLDRSPVNAFYDSWGGTERYKQRTAGADVRLSYLYYEVDAEYIHNQYNAPFIVATYGYSGSYQSGIADPNGLDLATSELLVDFKVDVAFVPGLYVAARYNTLMFGSIIDPSANSNTYGISIPWDNNVLRYAFGIGYKPVHSVLLKVNYEQTKIDVTPTPDLAVVAAQISVTF